MIRRMGVLTLVLGISGFVAGCGNVADDSVAAPADGAAPEAVDFSEIAANAVVEYLQVNEAGEIEHIETSYEEAIATDELVLVDYWASWCGPCKMLAPELEALAKEQPGNVRIVKVDVDQPSVAALAQHMGISGIPDVRVLRGGEEVDQVVGFGGENALKSKIEGMLAGE